MFVSGDLTLGLSDFTNEEAPLEKRCWFQLKGVVFGMSFRQPTL